MPALRRKASLPRGQLTFLEEGPTDGPLVLCLHGFPDIPRTFARLSADLAAAGYRVVCPWMRGYAPSTLEGPFHPDTIAADALALGDSLSPGRPFAVLGHDWGAVAAYTAALRSPGRLFAAVALSVPHPVALLRNLRRHPAQLRRSAYMGLFQLSGVAERRLARDDFAMVEALWRRWSPRLHPPVVHLDEVKRCLAQSLPAPLGYYRTLRWPGAGGLRWLRDAHRPIRVPTLQLLGDADGAMGLSLRERQERYFEGPFAAEVVADTGHFPHLEDPATVSDRVRRWLARFR